MKHGEIVGMAIKIHELVIYETTEEARSLRISSKIESLHFLGLKIIVDAKYEGIIWYSICKIFILLFLVTSFQIEYLQ